MGLFTRIANRVRSLLTQNDQIKHVVVLMFENHSFDQMLGCFKAVYPQLEGVDPNNLKSNSDSTGKPYPQRQANDTVVSPDPKHELDHILNQLKGDNSGFVSEYEKEYRNTPTPTTPGQRQRIMDYFGMGDLPVLHELAKHFAICDHWYSSVPGPTWANRFYVHSATSKGLVTMPSGPFDFKYYLHYNQDTIFDRLNEGKKKWRVYFGDVPQSLVLVHQRWPKNAQHYHLIHKFFDDAQNGDLPDYTFIEPNYFKGEQNDDHPPHATMRAQRLLAKVYNVLRANKSIWESTLFVVSYDEHGGFYDHISPPKATPPKPHEPNDEYSFDQFGVRVPALLISPWVERGLVRTEFDHTSLLRYVIGKWRLRGLTARDQAATSFADAIQKSGKPRDDTPDSVQVPPLMMAMAAKELPEGAAADVTQDELDEPENDLQRSLRIFADHLEQNEVPVVARAMRVMAAGPLTEGQQAKLQVQAFLNQQKAKAKAGVE